MTSHSSDAGDTARTIRTILSRVGPEQDLTAVGDQDSLLNAGVIDSLAIVNLVTEVETRFGITVTEDELVPEHFDSIAAITALVQRKLRPGG